MRTNEHRRTRFRNEVEAGTLKYVTEITAHSPGNGSLTWRDAVEPSQVVVLYFDLKSRSMRAPNGELFTRENGVLHVFDDLADARRYCTARIGSNALLGCLIYDASGKLLDTVEDKECAKRYRGRPASWRYTLFGILLFIGGAVCIVIDWISGWKLIFGPIVAVKLIALGAFFAAEGLAGLLYYNRRNR